MHIAALRSFRELTDTNMVLRNNGRQAAPSVPWFQKFRYEMNRELPLCWLTLQVHQFGVPPVVNLVVPSTEHEEPITLTERDHLRPYAMKLG